MAKRNIRVTYRQDADSDSVVAYEISIDGTVMATFDKPAGQVDGAEQKVESSVDTTSGSHDFTLTAVFADGTRSLVSNAVTVILPLAAPVLVSVEPF